MTDAVSEATKVPDGSHFSPPPPPPTPSPPPPAVCCSLPLPLGLSAPLFAQPPAPGVSPKLILPLMAGPPLPPLTLAVPRRTAWGQQRPGPKLPANFTAGAGLSQLEGLGMGAGAERRGVFEREGGIEGLRMG